MRPDGCCIIEPLGVSGGNMSTAERGRQQHCKTHPQEGHKPSHFGNPYDAEVCTGRSGGDGAYACPNAKKCAAAVAA